jgi:hypothetical protein
MWSAKLCLRSLVARVDASEQSAIFALLSAKTGVTEGVGAGSHPPPLREELNWLPVLLLT